MIQRDHLIRLRLAQPWRVAGSKNSRPVQFMCAETRLVFNRSCVPAASIGRQVTFTNRALHFTTTPRYSLVMAPSKQATLGKFLETPVSSRQTPQQQTKLSFKSKLSVLPANDGNCSQPQENMTQAGVTKRKILSDIGIETDVERRPKDVSKIESVPAPVAKRVRKGRRVIDDDDSDGAELVSPGSPRKPGSSRSTESPMLSDTPKIEELTTMAASETAIADAVSMSRSTIHMAKEDNDQVPSDDSCAEVEEDGDEDEVKPAAAARVRKTLQTVMSAPKTDAYPDWKAGEPVPYEALCRTFSLIELTTKRLIIMEYCALFLRQVLRLTPGDLLPTLLLMINKLAPDYAGIELGIGESLIMKAIGETTGRSLAVIKQDQKDIGDLGLVAVKSRSTQPTMFKPKPLTIQSVHHGLTAIATSSGNGAQQRKVDGIKKLLSAADARSTGKVDILKDKGGPSEAKFLVRFLEGKLRLGLAEKTVLVSLAQAVVHHEAQMAGKTAASPADVEAAEAILKTVYSELPSYDIVVPAMLAHGIMNLRENCKLRPGIPLKPMLAKPTKAITEVLDRFEDQTFTCEYKYDGERAQIHYIASSTDGKTAGLKFIFSRNSEDLSKKYPDILAKLHTWVRPETTSFVLDCETVAWDVAEGKVLPFQQLMTRKRKDVKIEDVKVKVCVFAFDLLYLNGEAIVEQPLRARRDLLNKAFLPVEGEFAMAVHMDGQELDAIQLFLDESVKASCEGLMVKMLDGAESGYEPSKRSRNWLKIKKDYLSGVGDSLDLVVLGAYFGKGKRTSVYGAFLLACHNPNNDTYETVCNIGTGFSEAILESLHAELSKIAIDRPKPFYAHSTGNQHQPDVWFEPRHVWEVRTADLTLSPRYLAASYEGVDLTGEQRGISLRFPRFIRIRDDKKPAEATTSRQVAEMYRKQESVAKSKGRAVDDDFEY